VRLELQEQLDHKGLKVRLELQELDHKGLKVNKGHLDQIRYYK
jgi:hypothetical protein